MVAECLGKLALIDAAQVLPPLLEHLKSDKPVVRSTAVTSFKFAITDSAPVTELRPHVEAFLDLMTDADLSVRRSGMLTFNSIVHNKPGLVRAHLKKFLPVMYGETVIKPELIREVNLGPFKHKVDDGLELRKAALSCMDTLLDTCVERIEFSEFLSHLKGALGDVEDIKLLAHLMLVKLSSINAACILEGLEGLVPPMNATLDVRVKENATKQDIERNDELLRSCIRAVEALRKLGDSLSSAAFVAVLEKIQKDPRLKSLQQSLSEDSGSTS
jgi:cullin-associated NEDD8-dissociated protein 1